MTVLCALVAGAAYVLMRDLGRPFAFTFAVLAACTVIVTGA